MFRQVIEDLQHSARSVSSDSARVQLLVPAQLQTGADPDDEPIISQLEPRDADSGMRLGIALTMSTVGLAAIGTSWAIYAERQSFRMQTRALVPSSVADSFAARGTWSLVTGALGAGLLSGAQFVWLPQTEVAVPTWAWLIGGAGLVGETVGLGFAAGARHCVPLATQPGAVLDRTCRRVTADVTFGWNIALDALPMLSLPLSFAVRSWFASNVQVALTGPGISLRGRF